MISLDALSWNLKILGPSNGRVWTCIEGVRALKIANFEGLSVFVGIAFFTKIQIKTWQNDDMSGENLQKWIWFSIVFCCEIPGRQLLKWVCENCGITLQGTNISHLGKRKIIFKMPFLGGYVSSLEGRLLTTGSKKNWMQTDFPRS